MKIITTLFLLFALVPTASGQVKLSQTGICHTTESPSYQRTTRFTPFADLSACLNAGGRLPKGVRATPSHTNAVKQISGRGAIPVTGYSRSHFGAGWLDTDGDCQDSRAEALIATSTIPAKLSGCKVVSGRWISTFTNNVIMDARSIDIDHTVPLHFAWMHGAQDWDQQKREKFANDPVNLAPVEANLNREKGSKSPSEWLPPAGQCQYVARFRRIVIAYKLSLSTHEDDWIRNFLARC